MNALSEMYSSLPRNLVNRDKTSSHQQIMYNIKGSRDKDLSLLTNQDKENTPTAASFFLRYVTYGLLYRWDMESE